MISTKFRSYSLRTAVIAFVLTPILAVAAAVGWYGLRSLEAQAEASMQEDIELIARAVRLPISYAMENGRMGAVHQALSSTTEFRRVYGIHVYNREGQRLATSGSPKAQVELEFDPLGVIAPAFAPLRWSAIPTRASRRCSTR